MTKYVVKAPMEKEDWQRKGTGSRVWLRIGYATEQDDGSILMTLKTIPVGPRWDGTLVLYPNDDFSP